MLIVENISSLSAYLFLVSYQDVTSLMIVNILLVSFIRMFRGVLRCENKLVALEEGT